MTALEQTLSTLDSHQLKYVHTSHSPAYTAQEVAAAEHLTPQRLAKTIILRSGDGYLMVVVASDASVDLENVRIATGASTLVVAREKELARLFPHAELGAMPPLGFLFNLPVYIDREISEQEFIAFNAGTHRDLVHMRSRDFKRVVRPVVGDFSQPVSTTAATFLGLNFG